MKKNIFYLCTGTIFGLALFKGEAVSWFRMQEMFRFQGFQIFGIFMTAIPVSAISVLLLKKLNVKTFDGEQIHTPQKKFNWGYVYGSALFGIGWGLTGSCPGPLYVQIGSGTLVAILTLLSALAGTWLYSYVRPKLPH
ncbi:MAG: YeeE/YedE family protein [Chitinophagales bacterium]|nr:YeeE/YedE family protein [Chitinophagales bacterium]